MHTDLERIKERIRKLLALAENDGAIGGEIDNAMSIAAQMMASYNLTRDDVVFAADGSAPQREPEYGEQHCYSDMQRQTTWESQLCWFLCEFVGTVQWYRQSGAIKRKDGIAICGDNGKPLRAVRIVFYGPLDDVEFAAELFNEVQLAIVVLARMRWGSHRVGAGGSYCEGFVSGLKEANRKAVAAIQQHSESRALVLRSQANAIALRKGGSQWLQSKGVELRKGGKRGGVSKSFSQEAYGEGKRDGAKYSLGSKSDSKASKPKQLGN